MRQLTNPTNGQELREILERYRLHADIAYSEVEDNFHTAEEFKTLALPKVLSEAKQAILDWHNKQIDYVIGEKDECDITVLRKYLPEDEARYIRDRNYARNFLRAEQRQRAECNKLKESK